jgi:hypothetical protein
MEFTKEEKKQFEEQSIIIGNKEKLSIEDEQILKKKGFKIYLLDLFNFYRRMKATVNCRKCKQTVRLSVRLNKEVNKAIDYCNKNLCKVCLSRTEKIRKN